MSKNRVLLSALTVVAIVCMASESATAQLFSGRLLGRRSANCCCTPAPAPAPAPVATCCGGTVAPTAAAVPVASSTPVVAAPSVMSTPVVSAPVQAAAPVVSSCCGGGMVTAPQMTYGTEVPMGTVMSSETLPMEQGVVYGGETVVESGEAVQASPSDNVVSEGMLESTTTSDLVQPPVAEGTAAPEGN